MRVQRKENSSSIKLFSGLLLVMLWLQDRDTAVEFFHIFPRKSSWILQWRWKYVFLILVWTVSLTGSKGEHHLLFGSQLAFIQRTQQLACLLLFWTFANYLNYTSNYPSHQRASLWALLVPPPHTHTPNQPTSQPYTLTMFPEPADSWH